MIKASILGASGYSGGELLRLLSRHPAVELESIAANQAAGQPIRSLYPWFGGMQSFDAITEETAAKSDVVFLALPAGEAMKLAPKLLASGKRVIDLSGDFRLKAFDQYERYYGATHIATELLEHAVYGMPELNPAEIASAQLLANPGCYPTSILLPLAPLLRESLIVVRGITINSLSGVTGAGRKATLDYSFSELDDSVKAYKVGMHQHVPEIAAVLQDVANVAAGFTFVPHLMPIKRGIFTTISAQLAGGKTIDDIDNVFQSYYGSKPFVRLMNGTSPQLNHVLHTNLISIGYTEYADSGTLILHSAIDNLLKGAAGQAVQNMNIMFGLSECEALH